MRGICATWPKCLLVLSICFIFVGFSSAQDKNQNKSEIAKRIDASARVLDEVMATPDKAIPDKVMSGAKCIAVIPSTVKIAVGFGGSHGKGVATCRTAHGWSAPAPITLTGGSWGLQLGGEAVDLVLVVMNQAGMDHLLSSKFKLGADASAAAGPVGRHAEASTDWKMRAEVLTYSRARGLFAGITVNGAAIHQDEDATRELYGRLIPFKTILTGAVATPAGGEPFVVAVKKTVGDEGSSAAPAPSNPPPPPPPSSNPAPAPTPSPTPLGKE